jgi:hypothetical protein
VEKQNRRTPKELINPEEFPVLVSDVWGWFIRLDSARQAGMDRQHISEVEVGAFFRNRQLKPELWQLDLIRQLDAASFEKKA